MLVKLLNVAETAAYLGISRHTVNSWISQRKIPFVKLGRRTLFRISDLEEWINKNTVVPKGTKGE